MNGFSRTDLASEAILHDSMEGVRQKVTAFPKGRSETVDIQTEEAARRLGKKQGRYVTFFTDEMWHLTDDEIDALSAEIGKELRHMILKSCHKTALPRTLSVLIAGLGNPHLTADAIGPETIQRLTVTRHIRAYDEGLFRTLSLCSIAAICPGVLGTTGIESAEMLHAITEKTRPDVLIAVDALAARSVERLASTVQIADSGIAPGAGIGNFRDELSADSLGLPVIAMGVPTVVDSCAMVLDALTVAGIAPIPVELEASLQKGKHFFVTPKESDVITEKVAMLLARSIMTALRISEASRA